MIRKLFSIVLDPVLNFLKTPSVVLIACLVLGAFALVNNGTIGRIWSFKNSKSTMSSEITKYKKMIVDIDKNIKKYYDLAFVKREAIDRFDLAGENDLIFVFSQEKKIKKEINFN